MSYEELLIEADNNNLITREKPLVANAGRIRGNRIAIKKDLPTQREKACILAEELGHFYTSAGNILDMTLVIESKKLEPVCGHITDKLVCKVLLIVIRPIAELYMIWQIT